MRLVQRLELRQEPTPASQADARAAASGPFIINSRKMKISPAVKELVERGMRTGTRPAVIASTVATTICNQADGGMPAMCCTACSSAPLPSSTTLHQ